MSNPTPGTLAWFEVATSEPDGAEKDDHEEPSSADGLHRESRGRPLTARPHRSRDIRAG